MSFRNWLLTGTSLTLLAFAPLAAAQNVQDEALVAATAAYQADQSETNFAALAQACATAGFPTVEECIAALSLNGALTPEVAAAATLAAATAAQASAEAAAAARDAG